MLNFTVENELCDRCRKCVDDCPSRIIEQKDNDLPFIPADKEMYCIQCQHCLAVCPTAAVSILGKNPYDSVAISRDRFPNLEAMIRLVRGRRSVRQYRDENVDNDLVSRLMHALANAPTGVNTRKLTFRLVGNKSVMHRIREKVMAELQVAVEAGRIPQQYAYLENVVRSGREQNRDILFRNAPHALIISTSPEAACPAEDVVLALAYFELMAQSAGLGTVWWGMLKMCLESLPELKPLFGIPEGHVYYGMLFGLPSVTYSRTVQRDDAAKVVRIE